MHKFLLSALIVFTSALLPLCADWTIPPIPVTDEGNNSNPLICCKDNGTAMAVWADFDPNTGFTFIRASYYNGTIWSARMDLSSGGFAAQPQLCCDPNGNFFAIWTDFDLLLSSNIVITRYFDVTTLSLRPPITISPQGFGQTSVSPKICCTGGNNAIAVWKHVNSDLIQYAYYDGNNWTSPATVTGSVASSAFPDISCDASGNVMAVWTYNTGNITIQSSLYSGGTWTPKGTVSGSDITAQSPTICFNDQGNAYVIWYNSLSTTIRASFYDGSVWSPNFTTITAPITRINFDICCDDNGNAMVIWSLDVVNQSVEVTTLHGSTIVSTQQLMTDPSITTNTVPTICCLPDNKAIALWSTTNGVFSSNFDGSTWSPPENISPGSTITGGPTVCCEDNGKAVALWIASEGGRSIVESSFFTPNVLPPATFSACRFMNRFATQSASFALLSWTPSPTDGVVSYQIFQNGVLIATVPASQLSYKVCLIPPCTPLTFTIKSVDAAGNVSPPNTIILLQ